MRAHLVRCSSAWTFAGGHLMHLQGWGWVLAHDAAGAFQPPVALRRVRLQMTGAVYNDPPRSSLLAVPNAFVVPGVLCARHCPCCALTLCT